MRTMTMTTTTTTMRRHANLAAIVCQNENHSLAVMTTMLTMLMIVMTSMSNIKATKPATKDDDDDGDDDDARPAFAQQASSAPVRSADATKQPQSAETFKSTQDKFRAMLFSKSKEPAAPVQTNTATTSTSTTTTTATPSIVSTLQGSSSSSSQQAKKSGGGATGIAGHANRSRQPDTSYERYTKGIGSKLMAKMGYRGGGAAPIEVKQRPKGHVGLGFAGVDARDERDENADDNAGKMGGDGIADDDDEETGHNAATLAAARAFERERDGWKRGKAKMDAEQYRVALDAESRSAATGKTTTTIIDMRGPETRVLANMGESGGVTASTTRKRMPELYNNVRLLVDVVRVELLDVDAKQAQRHTHITHLQQESARLALQVEKENEQIARVEKVQALIQESAVRVQRRAISLDELATLFTALQREYGKEYELFRLSRLVLALVAPLLRERLRAWIPLVDADADVEAANVVRTWRRVLVGVHSAQSRRRRRKTEDETNDDDDDENVAENDTNTNTDDDAFNLLVASDAARRDAALYAHLIDELAMPPLRLALLRRWKPVSSLHAIAALAAWRAALPTAAYDSLIDHCVLPRLERAIGDATTPEALQMHNWLLPWRALLGARFDALVPIAKRALALAFKRGADIAVADDTGRLAIVAWSAALDRTALQAICEPSIVDAIARRLAASPPDPRSPATTALESALAWHDVDAMPTAALVGVIEREWFAPWCVVIRQWLAQSEASARELADWYEGWKSLFPPAFIAAAPRLRALFNHALDLLKCRLLLRWPADALPAAPATASAARRRAHAALLAARLGVDVALEHDSAGVPASSSAAAGAHSESTGASGTASVRDAVADLAAERGVPFARAPRDYDGRAAYALGKHIVRFEGGLVLLRGADGSWKPASVDSLLNA